MGFPGGASGKEPACQCRRHPSLGGEDPLEKEMAVHSNILAWKIPWTEELAGYSPWSCKELDMSEHVQQSLKKFLTCKCSVLL